VTGPDLDVDARFLLANERTLLAWIRTALTLVAGGVALAHLGDETTAETVAAFVLVLAGAASAAVGAVRHRRADQALRSGRLPATGAAPYGLAVGVVVTALVLLVVLALDP
jgi:putative membrane protein